MLIERDEQAAAAAHATMSAGDALITTLSAATSAAKTIHAIVLAPRHTPDARVSIALLRTLVNGYALALSLLDGAEAHAAAAVDEAVAGLVGGSGGEPLRGADGGQGEGA